MEYPDANYPLLICSLIPAGIGGFIIKPISGTVISSLASMLKSSFTIFTIDLYGNHFNNDVSRGGIAPRGRIKTKVPVITG